MVLWRDLRLVPKNALVLTGLATFLAVSYPETVLPSYGETPFRNNLGRESVRDWRSDREPQASAWRSVVEKGETEDMEILPCGGSRTGIFRRCGSSQLPGNGVERLENASN